MKKIIFSVILSVILASCKNDASLETKYVNQLSESLNFLIQSNKLKKAEADLIVKYIDATKYDSTYHSVEDKTYKEILALALNRMEKEIIVIDSISIAKNSVSQRAMTICTNQPTPQGYVDISYGNSMSCPGWSPNGMNTKNIQLPTNNISVCSSSPIPNGYVVTRYGSSMSCPSWSPTGSNTMTLTIPNDNMSICSSSPVPNGYVVVSYGSSTSCPSWSPTGRNTKIIRILN
jgi:hypothetical protein